MGDRHPLRDLARSLSNRRSSFSRAGGLAWARVWLTTRRALSHSTRCRLSVDRVWRGGHHRRRQDRESQPLSVAWLDVRLFCLRRRAARSHRVFQGMVNRVRARGQQKLTVRFRSSCGARRICSGSARLRASEWLGLCRRADRAIAIPVVAIPRRSPPRPALPSLRRWPRPRSAGPGGTRCASAGSATTDPGPRKRSTGRPPHACGSSRPRSRARHEPTRLLVNVARTQYWIQRSRGRGARRVARRPVGRLRPRGARSAWSRRSRQPQARAPALRAVKRAAFADTASRSSRARP